MYKEDTIFHTIIDFLAGHTNHEQNKTVLDWINESENNKNIFLMIKSHWDNKETENIKVDVDRRFEEVLERIGKKRKNTGILVTYLAAASIITFIVLFNIYWQYNSKNKMRIDNASISETINAILPDGSSVHLNHNSAILYTKKIFSPERTVKIKGEIFFNVSPDRRHPFVVKTLHNTVTVTGTSFYIKTNDTMDIISVQEGNVRVSPGNYPSKAVVVHANNQAIWHYRNDSLIISRFNDINSFSWHTKKLRFKNASIKQVISEISKLYKIKMIVLDEKLYNCRFTGNMEYLTLDSVIEILSTTFNIQVRKSTDSLILIGDGC